MISPVKSLDAHTRFKLSHESTKFNCDRSQIAVRIKGQRIVKIQSWGILQSRKERIFAGAWERTPSNHRRHPPYCIRTSDSITVAMLAASRIEDTTYLLVIWIGDRSCCFKPFSFVACFTMKVWCKLDELDATRIEVLDETATVYDLKRIILTENASVLPQGCSPMQIRVSAADGSPLRPGTIVPCDTTYDKALIVKIGSSKVGDFPDPKKLKSKQSFDMNTLLSPLQVQPPTKPSNPEFTCSEGGW